MYVWNGMDGWMHRWMQGVLMYSNTWNTRMSSAVCDNFVVSIVDSRLYTGEPWFGEPCIF